MTATASTHPSAPPQPPGKRPDTGRLIGLLAWAHFLNDGAANYLPGVLPAVLAALGLPIAYAGAILATLIVGQALQPLSGAWSDRWGGRAMPVLGLAGTALGAAWVGWAQGLGSLLAALVLIGVANSLFHPPALASVRRFSSGSGERAISAFLVGGEIGRGLWPLLAGLVVATWGLHALWVLPLAAIPTLGWMWARLPSLPRRSHTHSALGGLRAAGRPLVWLLAYSGLRNMLLLGVTAFVPLLWAERGGSLVGGAGLITAMLVVGIAGNLAAAFLAEHWGRRRVVFTATAAACVLLPAFLAARGAGMWLALSGFGIAMFATFPLTLLMGQDLLPRHHSLGSGLALGLGNAIGAIGVAALGLLAARWHATGVLWAAEACGLLALAAVAKLPSAARAQAAA